MSTIGMGPVTLTPRTKLRSAFVCKIEHATPVSRLSSKARINAIVEEVGTEFVMTVTSGEDGGQSGIDEQTSEDRGGLFVHTMPR